MGVDVKQLELDRIVNLMKSFGWQVQRSEFQGEKIVVTMEKVVKPEVPR